MLYLISKSNPMELVYADYITGAYTITKKSIGKRINFLKGLKASLREICSIVGKELSKDENELDVEEEVLYYSSKLNRFICIEPTVFTSMFLERKGWRDEVNVNLFHKALQSYKTRIENEIFLLENTTIPEPSPTEVCNSLLEKYGPGFEKIHS